jgi:N4-gp56 family major capsid protein
MANAVNTGQLLSTTIPDSQRTYYEQLLLDTIRVKSILMNFCRYKEDFEAAKSGTMTFTEVLDASPDWDAHAESTVWLKGGHLDSRQVSLELEIHGDVLKFNDYADQVTYWNQGDLRGLVRGKLGQLVTDEIDILARNAFLSHGSPYYAGSANSARTDLGATDIMTPTYVEDVVVDLEESSIPGVFSPEDGQGAAIVCVTTPRVIRDIRSNADSPWMEVNAYEGTGRIFTGEVGMWNGVRFVKSNRLHMRNYGEVLAETTLDGAASAGDGAAAVDGVYNVGQTGATTYVTVADGSVFSVGDWVTIHDGDAASPPDEDDGSQETRKISAIDGNNISFTIPLLKDHSDGAIVTNGRDVHASLFIGGPSVVMGVGERPNIRILPKIDDLQLINRFSWRGFLKLQMFRPEYSRIVYSAGADLNLGS